MERFNVDTCKKVSNLLKSKVKRIVIIPHVNPDGDAIGSTTGLNDVFIHAGYESVVIVPNDFPSYLDWLGGKNKPLIFEKDPERGVELIKQADILFFLDFNDTKRLGKLQDIVKTVTVPVVLIDHHPDPLIPADYLFSDINVSSTAELVYEFIEEIGLLSHLLVDGANSLLNGIIADTGSFSHNASRPGMYHVAGELIKRGADKEKVNESLYNNFSVLRMRLLGHCLLNKMVLFSEYHTALIWLSKDELVEFDFQAGDTEGFVNYPLSIKGIVFSAFFMEKEDHIKLSFRSKGNFGTNGFASKHFNGGGHQNASGGEIRLPIDEAINLFKDVLPLYANQLNGEC